MLSSTLFPPSRSRTRCTFIDAEAIAEAVTKQNMRFVQIKTQEQLDWQGHDKLRRDQSHLVARVPFCFVRNPRLSATLRCHFVGRVPLVP
jgi:hypothetical protein